MFPIPLHIWFEAGALIVGLICWKKLKGHALALGVPFLGFIVLIELTGRYLNKVLHEANAWLYNISVPVEYLFYAFIFRAAFKAKGYKKMAEIFMILFVLFALVNGFFIQVSPNFNTNVLKIGSLSMIVFCCIYFADILQQETETRLFREPVFWIATGVFLFNAGEFFYTLFSDYFIRNHLDKTKHIFSSINNRLILILYTCFAISFLCMKSKPQKA